MGTREVYEEKLRTGNLHHDPTINPGLGSPRCPRCLSLLNPNSGNGEWTITSVLHDATAVAGSGLGAMLSAFYGLNTGIPYVQKHVKGPKWLPFFVGLPPFLMFTAGSAAFGGYGLPKFTQLTVTSYYTASSASHYGVSLLTRYIEDTHISRAHRERLDNQLETKDESAKVLAANSTRHAIKRWHPSKRVAEREFLTLVWKQMIQPY